MWRLGLRSRRYGSAASTSSATLLGDFGSFAPPAISSFVARDLRSAGLGYNRGDQLLIGFDRMTDRGGAAGLPTHGDKAFVDDLYYEEQSRMYTRPGHRKGNNDMDISNINAGGQELKDVEGHEVSVEPKTGDLDAMGGKGFDKDKCSRCG